MSRSDQYIGLTNDARLFLNKLFQEHDGKCSDIILCTANMSLNKQDIHGREVTVKAKSPNTKNVYQEIVQVVQWSSGPMYFTCLRHFLHKESGQILHMGDLFQWVLNPEVKEVEYDVIKGHYYI